MLDEESKAIQEVANSTGKMIDLAGSAGKFLREIFGESLQQMGGAVADWARYIRFRNFLIIADKVDCIRQSRKTLGRPTPIPPQFALPLFDAASLESEESIQEMWAGLIANSIDSDRKIYVRKVFLEILRGLEPLDARLLKFLADPGLDERFGVLTGTTLNADVISSNLEDDIENVKISLQALARCGCVIDSWENTMESIDYGYGGFRVENPKSNFRASHLGRELVSATCSR